MKAEVDGLELIAGMFLVSFETLKELFGAFPVVEPLSLLSVLPLELCLRRVPLDLDCKSVVDSPFAASELLSGGEQLPTFPLGV